MLHSKRFGQTFFMITNISMRIKDSLRRPYESVAGSQIFFKKIKV